MHRTDRFTLAAITAAAVLAAFLAATWIPAQYTPGPVLTWAVTYTGTVTGTAAITRMPVGRTLAASSLLVTAVLTVLLAGLRQGLDGLLNALGRARTAGIALLTTPEEAA
jgi:hypothetical protein